MSRRPIKLFKVGRMNKSGYVSTKEFPLFASTAAEFCWNFVMALKRVHTHQVHTCCDMIIFIDLNFHRFYVARCSRHAQRLRIVSNEIVTYAMRESSNMYFEGIYARQNATHLMVSRFIFVLTYICTHFLFSCSNYARLINFFSV